jgi:tRNA-Thr(GGU) m(6)t(6)A37 methyltransferase TsaA
MTHRSSELRPGEVAVATPPPADARLVFIGRIRTPWTRRADCPRQGDRDGPECRIEVFAPWDQGLPGLEAYPRLEVLYWLHEARRDLVLQLPRPDEPPRGTFSLRSPVRPNPIGVSSVKLERVEGAALIVRGLDCLDGTPLIDLKPDRAGFRPLAGPRKAHAA